MAINTELKRDSVNRVQGLVHLPIDGSRVFVGQTVRVVVTEEHSIDCVVRDAMEMRDRQDGDAVGDAIFDARVYHALGEGSDALGVSQDSGLPEELSVLGITVGAPHICDAQLTR